MGKANVTSDAICIRIRSATPSPDEPPLQKPEVTREIKDHGILWSSKVLLDRKNTTNYILQTLLNTAENNQLTAVCLTGTRNWTESGDWVRSRHWTRPPMVWTGSEDINTAWSVVSSKSKDWTSSGETEPKGSSFTDLRQTVPTSEDDDEVQGLLHHHKVTLLTSDLQHIDGRKTTEAEPVCETSLRDLANEDNCVRQMTPQRPELDFRKMQRKSFIRKSRRKRQIAPFQAMEKSVDEKIKYIDGADSAFTFKSLSLRLTLQNRRREN